MNRMKNWLIFVLLMQDAPGNPNNGVVTSISRKVQLPVSYKSPPQTISCLNYRITTGKARTEVSGRITLCTKERKFCRFQRRRALSSLLHVV
jgi:hypothetical protein